MPEGFKPDSFDIYIMIGDKYVPMDIKLPSKIEIKTEPTQMDTYQALISRYGVEIK